MLYKCDLIGEYVQMMVEDAVMASQGCVRTEDGWAYEPDLNVAKEVQDACLELASLVKEYALLGIVNDKIHDHLGLKPTTECMLNAMQEVKEESRQEWAWLDQ